MSSKPISSASAETPRVVVVEETQESDAESEELIFEALERLMAGKTSLTIAHRMATIRRAHTIYVVDDGIISARGSHDELLATSPLYARLFHLQFPDARLVGAR